MLHLIFRVLFDPLVASHVAAVLSGHPGLGDDLVRVCSRESRCQFGLTGIHRGDAGNSRIAWENAVRTGKLDPQCQPFHRGWSTRGAWGTMAAYTVVHVGLDCLPAEVIDVPLVGAYAAARRATHPECRHNRACRHWRGW